VDKAKGTQLQSSRILAELLQTPNPVRRAQELAQYLTEDFFITSSTYLEMARQEKRPEVVGRLEEVLRIAMEAKNKTLRPEIQVFLGHWEARAIITCSY